MQLDIGSWVGGIELSLERLDGWVDPRSATQEHALDDSSDVVALKFQVDCTREVLNANCPFLSILPNVRTG